MSEKFNGFSQDEINRVNKYQNCIRSVPPDGTKQAFRNPIGIRRMSEKTTKTAADQLRNKPTTAIKATRDAANVASSINNNNVAKKEVKLPEVNLDSSMSKSLEEELFFQPYKKTIKFTMPTNGEEKEKEQQPEATKAMNNDTNENKVDDSSILKLNNDSILQSNDDGSSLELNTDSPFKGISLKDFESHRKMIEEQNKQKKDMLYKAIEQHTQKTAAESRKIEEIRHELSKLETDLALDVALLRKQIDTACINFANVEKQYMKIEAQFLKAKIDLHKAAEKKDLLTEHLCTVIANKEDHKAQKLTELMEKVGLAPSDDYVAPTPMATPIEVDK